MVRASRVPKRSFPEAFVLMLRQAQMFGSCLPKYEQLIDFIIKSQQFLAIKHLFGTLDH
jgi:hypothetical protein